MYCMCTLRKVHKSTACQQCKANCRQYHDVQTLVFKVCEILVNNINCHSWAISSSRSYQKLLKYPIGQTQLTICGLPTPAVEYSAWQKFTILLLCPLPPQLWPYSSSSSSSSSVVIYTQRLKTTVTRCWRLNQTNTSSASGRKFRLWRTSAGKLFQSRGPAAANARSPNRVLVVTLAQV